MINVAEDSRSSEDCSNDYVEKFLESDFNCDS